MNDKMTLFCIHNFSTPGWVTLNTQRINKSWKNTPLTRPVSVCCRVSHLFSYQCTAAHLRPTVSSSGYDGCDYSCTAQHPYRGLKEHKPITIPVYRGLWVCVSLWSPNNQGLEADVPKPLRLLFSPKPQGWSPQIAAVNSWFFSN